MFEYLQHIARYNQCLNQNLHAKTQLLSAERLDRGLKMREASPVPKVC